MMDDETSSSTSEISSTSISTISDCATNKVNYDCMGISFYSFSTLLFVVGFVLFWGLMISFYFSRGGPRKRRTTKLPSYQVHQDTPPEYEVAKDKNNFPPFTISNTTANEELPSYNEVIGGSDSPV